MKLLEHVLATLLENNLVINKKTPIWLSFFRIALLFSHNLIEGIAILSVLVRNDNNFNKLIREVNITLKHLCKVYGFDFVCNDRIGKDLLWRDGLHHTDKVTSFVAINFLNFLNIYHGHGNLTDWQPILSKWMNAKPET